MSDFWIFYRDLNDELHRISLPEERLKSIRFVSGSSIDRQVFDVSLDESGLRVSEPSRMIAVHPVSGNAVTLKGTP